MKFFKKAREIFDRITGKHDAPPPVRPPATVEAEVILDPRFKYRRLQREYERRAKAVTVIHSGGTFNAGRNRDKRKGRAVMIARGASPRVAKRKQRDGIEFDSMAEAA